MPLDALRIRGQHNGLNALAALQLARVLDIGWAPMLRALREYAGEPHRAAFVRTIAEVDYINDSKGSNNPSANAPPMSPRTLKSAMKVPGTPARRIENPLSPTFREEDLVEKREAKTAKEQARDLVSEAFFRLIVIIPGRDTDTIHAVENQG